MLASQCMGLDLPVSVIDRREAESSAEKAQARLLIGTCGSFLRGSVCSLPQKGMTAPLVNPYVPAFPAGLHKLLLTFLTRQVYEC